MSVALPVSTSGRTSAQVARLCAREAGRIAMEAFRSLGDRRTDVVVKGRGNFLTETDLEVERTVLDILAREYPDHALMSEEAGGEPDGGRWMWVVDPLDGTHNFTRGIPYFAFNIALCRGGEPVLGLTYAPVSGDEFFAESGKGLTVNGRAAQTSTVSRLADCVLAVDLGYDDARAARMLGLVARLWPVQSVRVMGSAALGLAYAACGRYDLFMHNFLYPWDIAPGIVLVREGGGEVCDRGGGPATIHSQGIVAGGAGVVGELLDVARDQPWQG